MLGIRALGDHSWAIHAPCQGLRCGDTGSRPRSAGAPGYFKIRLQLGESPGAPFLDSTSQF